MERLVRVCLIFFAIGSLIFAVIALFFPVKSSFIRGYLDSGAVYQRWFWTYAYATVGGYLLLLAGVVNTVTALRFQKCFTPLEFLSWSVFSGFLILCLWLAGRTSIFSWLPSIPGEIQHAIGSPYVYLVEYKILNIPQVFGSIFTLVFVAFSTPISLIEFYLQHGGSATKPLSPTR
ncbi:MAG: hypothetical protein QME54_00080 [Actinomycetota bacterium]|nr:hypothetical protein [Actinomycetota bacterium]